MHLKTQRTSSLPRAVTFIRVPSVAPGRTAAYEKWYDTEHIPLRMSKPGFLGAQRYDMLVGHQRYFVVYELADARTVTGKEYLALRAWEREQPPDSFEAPGTSRPGFERGIYDQLAGPQWPAAELRAPFVHVAGYHPDGSRATRFQAWLCGQHLADLSSVVGVVGVRAFALTSSEMGSGTGMHTPYPRFLAAAYLESQAAIARRRFVAADAAARKQEGAPDAEPYVVVGRLVHSADGGDSDARERR
jgi:hypothetical protein